MSGVVERFAALFAGREDAFGTEQGGCVRPVPWATEGAFEKNIEKHLNGTPIGVYPMVPRTLFSGHPAETVWEVKWGCIDLDVKGPSHATGYDSVNDALVAAQNLTTALRALEIHSWIERTRSGGFHVWVFAAEWVPAATMRRALLVACAVVEVPPSEVNPKSEGGDNPEFLGNYVRLPYPGGNAAYPPQEVGDERRVILKVASWGNVPMRLEEFLVEAERKLTSTETLEAAAALHVPPAPERIVEFEGGVDLDDALQRRLGGLAFTILEQGPLDGGDRSGALFKLAHCCVKDGLEPDETLAVVTAADERWGKYWNRPDGERYLMQTVERAYR